MKYAFHWLVVVVLLAQNLPTLGFAPVYRGSAGELSASNPVSDSSGWLQETEPPVEQTPLPTETGTPKDEPTPSGTLTPTEPLLPQPTDTPTAEPAPTDITTPEPKPTEEVLTQAIRLSLQTAPHFVNPGKSLELTWQLEGIKVEDLPTNWLLVITVPTSFVPLEPEIAGFDPESFTLQLPVSNIAGTIEWQVADTASGPFPIEARLLNENSDEVAFATLLLDQPPGLTRIDASGGEAIGLNGRLKVKFSSGAISQPIGVAIEPLGASFPYAVRLTAADWASTEPVHQFAEMVELEWAYDEADFDGDANALTWFYYDEEKENWIALPTVVDADAQIVRGWTDHFSDFAIDLQDWQAAKIAPLSSAEVSQFTGAATYSIPIRVPDGPGGMAPSISLDYNSQLVDNATNKTQASWVGMGWTLSAGGSIQRNLRNDLTLDHDDTFSMVIGNQSFSLVPVSHVRVDSRHAYTEYKTSDDNFWKVRRYRNDEILGGLEREDYWIVWDQAGTRYTFDKRAYYFAFKNSYYSPGNHYRSFLEWGWYLTSIQYPSGQSLMFYYDFHRAPKGFYYQLENGGWAEAAVIDLSIYLTDIVYPDSHTRIRFVRDSGRTDYDPEWFTNYANHNLGDRYRLSKIQVLYDPAITHTTNEYWEGTAHITLRDNVVVQSEGNETILWEYRLGYTPTGQLPQVMPGIEWPAPEGSTTKGRTLTLMSVTEYGLNGQTSMPATTFNYSEDNLHLDQVNNGQGGRVEFSYEKWHASEASTKATISKGWSDGNYPYVNDHDRIHAINGSGMASFRPGTEYRVSCRTGSSREAMDYWLDYGAGQIWYNAYSTDYHWTEWVFTLPANASKAATYIRTAYTVPGTALTECSTRYFITRYRVIEKRVFDGINSTPHINTYEYAGAAVNNSSNSAIIAEVTSLPKFVIANSEFRGHSLVKVTDPKGLQTWTYFHQDDARQGRANKIEQYNASVQLLSRREIDYFNANASAQTFYNLDFCAHKIISDEVSQCYADPRVYWNYATYDEVKLFPGGGSAYSGIRKEFHYQTSHQGSTQYGHLTHLVESFWDGTTWQDERLQVWRYYPNHTNSATMSLVKYLVGLPGYHNQYSCPETTNGDCFNPGMSDPGASRLLSSAWSLYDDSTIYSTTPTAGFLTGERTLLYYTDPVTFTGPMYQDTRYDYDSWGNLNSISRYPQAGGWSSLWQGGAQTTTVAYDSTFHARPVWQRNALAQQTDYTYSGNGYWCGQPSSITGPNGPATSISYTYDDFCRLKSEVHPGDSVDYPTVQYTYVDTFGLNAPVMAQKIQRIVSGSDSQLYTERHFFDGLGRLVQVQVGNAEIESGTKDLIVDYLYNADGQVMKETMPYAVIPWPGTGTAFRSQDFSRPSTITVYDDLGRIIQTQRPDGYPDTTYVYDGLETLVTDANGHATRQVRDPWGRLVEVHPPAGPWTGYSYDDLNRLTEARQYVYNTTTLIGTTTIAYDYAGRKTGLSDPDMGTWAYSYFANGTLHTQTDANGCLTTLTYNALDQLTAKQFSGACDATADVSITYHDPSVDYSKSRRTLMTDGSGSTSWTYDARGRVLSETKTITGGGAFLTQWTYNSADQVETMTYPGGPNGQPGEVVTYTYLTQGLVDAVSGASTYVQDSTYDEAQRTLQRVLGAGAIQTTFGYYPWTTVDGIGRLQSIQSVAGSTGLQQLSYAYDGVGNVRTITDALAGPQTQTFLYDEVDRLSSAEAAGGSGGGYPLESYTYDTFGRLSALPGTGTFGYGVTAQEPSPPLHAVTAAGGVDYVYDAAGNLSQKEQGGSPIAQFGYDGENRLTSVSGEDTASFVYDGDGNRVKGTVNGQTTYYVGNYLEVSDGQASPQPGSDELIPYGSIWKFLDIGQQPDAGWTGLNFDDSDWDSGNAILGYGDGHETTLVYPGPVAIDKYITTYFRKTFYANDDALYDAIEVSLDYDDGGVVYLNGVELFRANLPAGTISYSTLAATSIEDTTVTHVIDITDQLRTGANVLAVEIHQQGPTSSDLHFDLELVGHRPVAFPADTFIDAGATWKYYASGAAPASGWTGASFDDSSWASGAAILGYGDGHEATVVPYGGDPNNKYITTYFRKSFTVADPSQYGTLDVILDFEDGAVVYLNGVELRRENLPAGTIGYSTLAPYALNDTTAIFRVNATALQAGTNVLAVEVHQQSRYSSDLHFELRLLGNRGGATLVEETLIAADGSWKYLDNGSDQGTAWRETSFNDASWAAGAAILGYGDGHETTVVSYGGDPNNKHITTYFRTSFQIDDPSQYLALDLAAVFDDGIAIYLNGVELVRGNLPAGPISYTTLAPYGVDDVTGTASFDPAGLLVAGTNLLAAEVHQVSGSSSDLHFELELQAVREEEGQGEPGAAVWRQYYYAAGQRVAVRDGRGSGTAGLSFLLGDHLGSTHVTTDASGAKVAELRYKPWGDVRYADGSTPTTFRFTGQREEGELGIYYYGARWYDPTLGHFLQADNLVPDLVDPTAYNRYAYTLYNPVKYTDPTGHKAEQGTGGGIGGLGLSESEEKKILQTYATIQSISPGSVVNFIEPISNNAQYSSSSPSSVAQPPNEDTGPLTELMLDLPGTAEEWSAIATGFDAFAWLSDAYAVGAVTYGGIAGAAIPAPLVAAGLPEVPVVTGLAGIAIAELYVQPVLVIGNSLATMGSIATIVSDTKAGITRIEEFQFSSSTANSISLTTVGWLSNEAYLSFTIQTISVANDLKWISLPFPQ